MRGFMIYYGVLATVLGAVLGSFVNCMAWRMVHGGSVLSGRSACPTCGHTLGAKDLVPVFSYLTSKGKCRYCHTSIPLRYLLVELLMAAGYLGLFLRYGISARTLCDMGLCCILLAVSLIDLEIYEIPNVFILAGVVWWIVTLPFVQTDILNRAIHGLMGGAVMGAIVLAASLIMDNLLQKETMGGGDIKLLFITGLYVGLAQSLLLLLLSCIFGIALAYGTKKHKIPFGPAIAASCYVVLLVGEPLVTWYLSLF